MTAALSDQFGAQASVRGGEGLKRRSRGRRAEWMVLLSAAGCWGLSAVLIAACAGPSGEQTKTIKSDGPAFKLPAKASDLASKAGAAKGASSTSGGGGEIANATSELADVFAQLNQGQESERPGGPSGASAASPRSPRSESVSASTGAASIAETPALPLRAATPGERKAELAQELAGVLRTLGEESAEGSELKRAMSLMALELIEPGAGGIELARVEQGLTAEERAVLSAMRSLLSEAGEATGPTEIGALLAARARQLGVSDQPTSAEGAEPDSSSEGLSLGTVALAQRVESYGRFVEFNSDRFVGGAGGRTLPMLVYTEVMNFAQPQEGSAPSGGSTTTGNSSTADSAGGEWVVELGQELRLFAADGSEQWREPERIIRNTSRSKRSDYYLVQRIELPGRLSVGRYALKVIVRDKLSGEQSERNIPLQIVADASVIGSGGSGPGGASTRPTTRPSVQSRSTQEPERRAVAAGEK